MIDIISRLSLITENVLPGSFFSLVLCYALLAVDIASRASGYVFWSHLLF